MRLLHAAADEPRSDGGGAAGASIYRDDLLPVPAYVLRCVRAHRVAGGDVLANLLDHSFLGDGQTTLRAHLRSELSAAPVEAAPMAQEEAGASAWTTAEREELLAAIAAADGAQS